MTRSTNIMPPFLGPRRPDYPPLRQIVRVGSSSSSAEGGGSVFDGWIEQSLGGAPMLRDREACVVWEPNGLPLSPGTLHKARLMGSYQGLPLLAVSALCCTPSGFSSRSSISISSSETSSSVISSFISSLASISSESSEVSSLASSLTSVSSSSSPLSSSSSGASALSSGSSFFCQCVRVCRTFSYLPLCSGWGGPAPAAFTFSLSGLTGCISDANGFYIMPFSSGVGCAWDVDLVNTPDLIVHASLVGTIGGLLPPFTVTYILEVRIQKFTGGVEISSESLEYQFDDELLNVTGCIPLTLSLTSEPFCGDGAPPTITVEPVCPQDCVVCVDLKSAANGFVVQPDNSVIVVSDDVVDFTVFNECEDTTVTVNGAAAPPLALAAGDEIEIDVFSGTFLRLVAQTAECIPCSSSSSSSESPSSLSSCQGDGVCRYAIYIGNENAITDDNFAVFLNGVQIATTVDDTTCGPPSVPPYCRGTLILPASMLGFSAQILGSIAPCTGTPITLAMDYASELEENLPCENTVDLVSIQDNHCGNFGIFRIYPVSLCNGVVTLGTPLVDGVYNSTSQSYSFHNACCSSSSSPSGVVTACDETVTVPTHLNLNITVVTCGCLDGPDYTLTYTPSGGTDVWVNVDGPVCGQLTGAVSLDCTDPGSGFIWGFLFSGFPGVLISYTPSPLEWVFSLSGFPTCIFTITPL